MMMVVMSKLLKNLSKSVALVVSLSLVGASVPAIAAPPPVTANGITTQTAAASDAFPGYKAFLNMPANQRSQVNLYYALRIKRTDPSKVHVTLTHAGKTTPIQIGAGGRLSPLPTREQLNGGATIKISGPEGAGVAMKIHPYSTQPNSQTYDAAGLATGIKQGNAATSQIAGPLALMLPKLDRVYFIGGGNGEVEFANGQKKPLPRTAQAGEYPAGTPYFVPSQMAGAAHIKLSAVPSIAHFDTPPK